MHIAIIQMKIRRKPEDALDSALKLLQRAANGKAKIAVLPELFAHMWLLKDSHKNAETKNGKIISALKKFAKERKITIIAGSIFERTSGKPLNTAFVIDNNGKVLGKYSKMHLFDIRRKDLRYSESDFMQKGKEPLIIKIGGEKFGVAICNDLRFPELFRHYALNGAIAVFVPSAFTHKTGKFHWHLLNRARSVENQMYVLSANMCSKNSSGVKFFGHSFAIDPWGKILCEASGNKDEIIFANIDPKYVKRLRKELPTLRKVISDW